MATALESLLRHSRSAALAGRTVESWTLATQFATRHWLATADDVADELRGEFFTLRATVADHLRLHDEGIQALHQLREWARDHGDHAAALVATAHLAYYAQNVEPGTLSELSSPAEMLAQLADDLARWRPDADSPTIAEDDSLTWQDIPAEQAAKITQAATIGFTVAVNLSGGDAAASQQFTSFFTAMVRRFGSKDPSPADRLLWLAQQAWSEGRWDDAFDLADQVHDLPDVSVASSFEAHDVSSQMLLMLISARGGDEELEQQLARRLTLCSYIAVANGAAVVAINQAELAGRLVLADRPEFYDTLEIMMFFLEGAPLSSPAMLNLSLITAAGALGAGDKERARQLATAVAQWSAFTPDAHRTEEALAIAEAAQ